MSLKDHPLACIFPLLPESELKELSDDMKANGQEHPIVLLDGMILDGRNRYRACKLAGIEPRTKKYDGDNPVAFVISENVRRRHLTESQRAMVGAELETVSHGGKRHYSSGNEGQDANLHLENSREQIAESLNVSTRSVATAKKVKEEAEPEIVEAVKAGKLPVSTAAKTADLPPKKQREIARAKNPKKAAAEATKKVEPQIVVPTQVDEWGIPIQEHAAEAFEAIPKFKELVATIQLAQKQFNALANTTGGKFLTLPEVSSYRRGKKTADGHEDKFVHEGLERALHQVKLSAPAHTICPWNYVDAPHPDDCRTCKGMNWTPELGSIPEVARERARKAFGVKEAA